MTQEDVIVLWKDANGWDVKGYETTLKDLERFAKLVAEKAVRESSAEYRLGWNDGQIAEREACAKTLESISNAPDMQSYANAIRARGKA